VDPQEYLGYLRHSIAFAHWFGDPAHRASLTDALRALPPSGGELRITGRRV
jgi:hypothetical protein